jgi:protein-S-isoprenylcysteine O-methyltransferase Ste14
VLHTRDMTRSAIGWTLVLAQGVLLVVLLLLPWREPTLLSLAVGVPLMAGGILLGLVAGRRLGGALTPTPVPIPGAGLRTDGLYSRLRHPIYSAILLAVLGLVVAIGSWWSLAWALLILVFFSVKYRWEDRMLHAEYGDAWVAWSAQTGALIPRARRAPGA